MTSKNIELLEALLVHQGYDILKAKIAEAALKVVADNPSSEACILSFDSPDSSFLLKVDDIVQQVIRNATGGRGRGGK